MIATGGEDGVLIIRNSSNLEELKKISAHAWSSNGVKSIAFSHDFRFIMSTGADGSVFVWEIDLPDFKRSVESAPLSSVVSDSVISDLLVRILFGFVCASTRCEFAHWALFHLNLVDSRCLDIHGLASIPKSLKYFFNKIVRRKWSSGR